MVFGFVKAIFRTWFTGVLYCLAALGYVLYATIWVFRFMQKLKVFFLVSAVVLCVAAAAAAYLFVPFNVSVTPTEMVIDKGEAIHAIARKLKQEGVIRSSLAFVAWVKLTGVDKKVQAGKVTFFAGEQMVSAAQKLLHAEPLQISLTVPEGLTVEQTGALIAETTGVDSATFVTVCNDPATLQKIEIPAESIEGYLFPDTYNFPPDVKAFEIIKRMVNHGSEMYATLSPDSSTQGLSRRQILTLASIVEKEATLGSERPIIAGVFSNRLSKRMALGADPTVRYVLRKFSGPLFASELAIRSPYNTRLYVGLPPGPICSPGLAALRAALFPEKTRALYFVAKWDGSGAHDFSATNEEHERKKMQIRRMNELRKENIARRQS